jgi:Leucine-rich repeat (LRR) protein
VLSQNRISGVSKKQAVQKSLKYLNLSFNLIENRSLAGIIDKFPHLIALDLSYNNINDLKELVFVLSKVPSLKMLNIFGNPICLLRNTAAIIKNELPELIYLDKARIKASEESDQQQSIRNIQDLLF